jgi:hypothetical protein
VPPAQQHSHVLPTGQNNSTQHRSTAPLPAAEAPAGLLHLDSNAASKQQQMDVWVLAGQSNCVGTNHADGQDMPAAAQPWPGKIFRFDATGRCVTQNDVKCRSQRANWWHSLRVTGRGFVCGRSLALCGVLKHNE